MDRHSILAIGDYPAWDFEALDAAYEVHRAPRPNGDDPGIAAHAEAIEAIVTRGELGAPAALMKVLPNLKIVSVYGVGYDAVDRVFARDHGIVVTNTPDVLTEDVADLGLALLLAAARKIIDADAYVRSGRWEQANMPLAYSVTGRRVGLVGMGRIGQALARRLAAMNCEIAYFSRTRRAELPYRFAPDVVSLAGSVDYLVVTVAGGEATRALVGAEAIAALGPDGVLVNISRGTTIDEPALLAALERGAIRGAALDVFVNEPRIDPRFRELRNVVLQPHMGSATVETRKAMGQAVRNNLAAFFAGRPLPSAVPPP